MMRTIFDVTGGREKPSRNADTYQSKSGSPCQPPDEGEPIGPAPRSEEYISEFQASLLGQASPEQARNIERNLKLSCYSASPLKSLRPGART